MKRKKPFECQSNQGNTPPHKMRLKNSKLGDINFQIRVCVTHHTTKQQCTYNRFIGVKIAKDRHSSNIKFYKCRRKIKCKKKQTHTQNVADTFKRQLVQNADEIFKIFGFRKMK